MSKADWGVKRLCQGCGAKFYDMKNSPITCPSCSSVFDPESQRARRPRAAAKAPKPVVVVSKPKTLDDDDDDTDNDEEELAAAELTDDIEDDADSGGDDLLADTDDLEGGDDKVPAVAVSRDEDES